MSTTEVSDIIGAAKLSTVFRALTRTQPRRSGGDRYRGVAVWRGGNNLNVAIDDHKSTWFDHGASEGGGVLDLIITVSGGSRQDALRWLADFAGVSLVDRQLSPKERAQRAQRKRQLERDLPAARLWRRAAVCVAEETLAALKAALFDPMLPSPATNELRSLTRELARLQGLDGAGLADEFRAWRERAPRLTAGMVKTAEMRDAAERQALARYLDQFAAEVE